MVSVKAQKVIQKEANSTVNESKRIAQLNQTVKDTSSIEPIKNSSQINMNQMSNKKMPGSYKPPFIEVKPSKSSDEFITWINQNSNSLNLKW